jgi:hypothetical protein
MPLPGSASDHNLPTSASCGHHNAQLVFQKGSRQLLHGLASNCNSPVCRVAGIAGVLTMPSPERTHLSKYTWSKAVCKPIFENSGALPLGDSTHQISSKKKKPEVPFLPLIVHNSVKLFAFPNCVLDIRMQFSLHPRRLEAKPITSAICSTHIGKVDSLPQRLLHMLSQSFS